MLPGLAGFSRTSLLAKAPNAASLDPMLCEQLQRRRALWSFLTWAFLLAEAARDTQADASASRVLDDPDWKSEATRGDAGAPAPLTTDEPTPRDWSVPRPVEASELGLASHGLQGLPGAMSFDPPERLAEPAVAAVQDASAGTGGQEQRSGHHAGAQAADDAPTDVGEADARADGHDAAELDVSLDLPPTGGLVQDPFASLPVDLDDAASVLPLLGDVTAVVSSTTVGLLALTNSLLGGAMTSGGSISLDALSTKFDPGLDDLFADGRYTDYHLALQLEPLGALGGEAATPSSPTLALDTLVPLVAPEQAHHGDTGETVLPLGLPSMVDELLQRSAVDLLM
jgi:hypothetical protein